MALVKTKHYHLAQEAHRHQSLIILPNAWRRPRVSSGGISGRQSTIAEVCSKTAMLSSGEINFITQAPTLYPTVISQFAK
jgi:hypothetical protein